MTRLEKSLFVKNLFVCVLFMMSQIALTLIFHENLMKWVNLHRNLGDET